MGQAAIAESELYAEEDEYEVIEDEDEDQSVNCEFGL